MASEERVMTLLVQSNPVPDVESVELTEIRANRYLAILDQRSSEMTDTKVKPQSTKTDGRRRTAAMATAAVVIAVVGLAAWLASNNNRADPVAGVAIAEEFARAVTSGETDLTDYVTEDATFGPIPVPLDGRLASFWAGLGTSIVVRDCEQTAQVVRCDYESSDRIRQAQERPEYGILTFLIEGSKIGTISRSWDEVASQWLEAGDPVIHYLEWLNQNHPGWDSDLDWVGEPLPIGGGYAPLAHDDPVRNARYAEALTRYLDEYAQELQAAGGLSG